VPQSLERGRNCLPQQDVKGLKLVALLRVGEETKPLNFAHRIKLAGRWL